MTGIKTVLRGRVSGERLFHAYIIAGSSEEGRIAAARYIAKTAVCVNRSKAPCSQCRHCIKADKNIHPDITVTGREKDAKELTVDAVRAVRSAASVMPNEAERSVYIIRDADTMNVPAQNAILKILEEPPSHAVFVLLASNPDRMLPTVRSRCETIILPPEDELVPSAEADEIIKCYKQGDSVGLLSGILALEKLGKNELMNALAGMRRGTVGLLRDGRMDTDRAERIIAALDNGEKYMAVNVSAGYIAGLLLSAFAE